MWLYWLGLLVHLILILIASDIFFQKYIGTSYWKCEERNGIAERVVFIVVEGLNEGHLSYGARGRLARVINNGEGVWGAAIGNNVDNDFSGNVALLSGFSVDPVTTYCFRHLFDNEPIDNFLNRSNEVFYIGSKQVYEYLYKRKSIEWWSYFYPEWKRYFFPNSSNFQQSDLAVHQLSQLFANSLSNNSLNDKLHSDKSVFFIYFDSIGKSCNTNGCNSKATNGVVDALFNSIEVISKMVESYYSMDGKTTFVICSNSIPTKLSGKILPSAIITHYPFIAWGAGIKNQSSPVIINQLDMPALISTLLGLSYPSNSRGKIPVSLLNIKQNDFNVAQVCKGSQLYSLALEAEIMLPHITLTESLKNMNMKMNRCITNSSYYLLNVYDRPETVIDTSLNKIREQENFFKCLLWCSSLLLSIGWILLIFSQVIPYQDCMDSHTLISFSQLKLRLKSMRWIYFDNRILPLIKAKLFPKPIVEPISSDKPLERNVIVTQPNSDGSRGLSENNNDEPRQNELNERHSDIIRWRWLRGITDIMFFLTVSSVCLALFFLEWEPKYFLYLSLPIIFIWLFSYTVIGWVVFAKENFLIIWKEILLYCVIFILASCLLINGFHSGLESIFGATLIFMSLSYINRSSWPILAIWLSTGCLILLFDINGLWYSAPPLSSILIPTTISVILWNAYASFRLNPKGIDFFVTIALLWQSGMTIGCILFTDSMHSASKETPLALKATCCFLILSYFFPVVHGKNHSSIILNICIALSVPFVLLSTSYEPLLYLLLCNFMISWMLLEGYSDDGKTKRELDGQDARRALQFIYFCFYIGKILGSTCSFVSKDVFSIRCFTETMYEPLMTLLLLMKPVIIYTIMTAIFLIISCSNGVKKNKEFALVILLFQLISVKLFLMIDLNEDGTLPRTSVPIVFSYFAVNVFAGILIGLVLFCKYIYRLPVARIQ